MVCAAIALPAEHLATEYLQNIYATCALDSYILVHLATFDQEKQLSVLAGAIFLVPSIILSGTAWTLKKSGLKSQKFKVGRI